MSQSANQSKNLEELAKNAKSASRLMCRANPASKTAALNNLAKRIWQEKEAIYAANRQDVSLAVNAGMDKPRIDRLTITDTILTEMCDACRHVANLADPVGTTECQWQQPNGLLVGRMRIPLGVVAIIYEARPNVTIDAAILCIRAGNAVILRGGSDAINTNMVLAGILQKSLEQSDLPENAVQLVTDTDHSTVNALCKLDQYIDVIIPRGGEGLVKAVTEAATMPVLKHFKGVCHAFIDSDANEAMALEIVFNSKVQRPGVCNALECLLVHTDLASSFLPKVAERLGNAGVEFRACKRSLPLLGPTARLQQEADLGQEFHDLILAVNIVESIDKALEHISQYGSNHTEIICTNNLANANRFLREADASMVAVNAATRFNDGGQLGLGAEIGISTSKLHAYGPMGVRELTTTKFVVIGNGQVRR